MAVRASKARPAGRTSPSTSNALRTDLSAGVVLVLAESRMGGDGARAERGEREDEAPGADVPGRRDGQAGRLQGALESRGIEVPRVLGLLPGTDVSPFSPQKEPGSGERPCRGKGVAVEDYQAAHSHSFPFGRSGRMRSRYPPSLQR